METLMLEILKTQGIWAVLFFFTFVYLIKFIGKWNKSNEEREKKHLSVIDKLTCDLDIVQCTDKRVQNIDRKTQTMCSSLNVIDGKITAIHSKVAGGN